MEDHSPEVGRRVVVNVNFETALGALSRALREEGFSTLARIDVRDHFMRDQRHLFRLYEIIDAWSPEVAVQTLSRHLDVGVVLPARFAIYALSDDETAVLANDALSSMAANDAWRADFPDLAAAADVEADRLSRVLANVQRRCQRAPVAARRDAKELAS